MQRTWNTDTINKIGEEVTVKGWVHARRDMGKVIFIDLRDKTGLFQVVFVPSDAGSSYEFAKTLRGEYVISVTGKVQARGAKAVNPKIATGTVELLASELQIFNESKTPP